MQAGSATRQSIAADVDTTSREKRQAGQSSNSVSDSNEDESPIRPDPHASSHADLDDSIDYMASLLAELHKCAKNHDLKFLAYLINMAAIEAGSMIASRVGRGKPG